MQNYYVANVRPFGYTNLASVAFSVSVGLVLTMTRNIFAGNAALAIASAVQKGVRVSDSTT